MAEITNILKKLSLARTAIGRIDKDGIHKVGMTGAYSYMTDETIAHKVREAFRLHGIIPLFDVKIVSRDTFDNGKGTRMTNTVVQVDYRFYDEDSGELVYGSGVGEASDSSDKGLTKAITSAIKYIYIKTFTLSTKDDIEANDPDVDVSEQGNVASKKIVKPNLTDEELNSEAFYNRLIATYKECGSKVKVLERIKVKYNLTKEQEDAILNLK